MEHLHYLFLLTLGLYDFNFESLSELHFNAGGYAVVLFLLLAAILKPVKFYKQGATQHAGSRTVAQV